MQRLKQRKTGETDTWYRTLLLYLPVEYIKSISLCVTLEIWFLYPSFSVNPMWLNKMLFYTHLPILLLAKGYKTFNCLFKFFS